MEIHEEEQDRAQLRGLRTRDLIGHAVTEAKLVARAEVLHARAELKDEAQNAKLMAVFLVPALTLALCALAVLFVLVAMALPLPRVAALAIVFGFLVIVSGVLAALAYARLPKKPMGHTLERLSKYLEVREELRH
jgi:uncharacterized protein YhhL (DUF1145 family)